jgi:ubiquinone/menaquinone biosynthesis C-methylase UbiE
VLDVGCGTGSLAVQIKRLHPAVEVAGVDPDPRALARAERKTARAQVSVRLERAFGDALPCPDASFDRVLSCFVFHHLGRDAQAAMLREARRVLKPGGLVCLLDFEGPESGAGSPLARRLHGSAVLRHNGADRILTLMRQAGLTVAKRVSRGTLVFGLLAHSCFEATAPEAQAGSFHRDGP